MAACTSSGGAEPPVTKGSAPATLAWQKESPANMGPINRPTNPFQILYRPNPDGLDNLSQWARPGALVIVGRDNYNEGWVHTLADAGCTVLIYLHPNLMNTVGRYASLLYNASQFGPAVPDWPGGPYVVDQWGNLADFRVGSLCNTKFQGVLNLIISENPHISGFFLDGLGTSPSPGAGGFSWDAFPMKTEYRNGALEQCQIARAIADANDMMIIVNGLWQAGPDPHGGGYPDRFLHGCSLVDGGMIEDQPPIENGFHHQYCTLPTAQWGLDIPRIASLPVPRGYMLSTNPNKSEMDAWVGLNAAAYAHYGDYMTMTPPWATFTDFNVPNRKL